MKLDITSVHPGSDGQLVEQWTVQAGRAVQVYGDVEHPILPVVSYGRQEYTPDDGERFLHVLAEAVNHSTTYLDATFKP